jgi:hypothetical protein
MPLLRTEKKREREKRSPNGRILSFLLSRSVRVTLLLVHCLFSLRPCRLPSPFLQVFESYVMPLLTSGQKHYELAYLLTFFLLYANLC